MKSLEQARLRKPKDISVSSRISQTYSRIIGDLIESEYFHQENETGFRAQNGTKLGKHLH